MLKLKKIYIENFKGISGTRIIDFDSSDLSILNGPNGFGKTTIFDAIELCLRGMLERTVQFGNIQKNNQNFKKPFYQHTAGREVTLKTLFVDSESGAVHILIKYLDKDHNGKIGNSKTFRPDAWGILETYYSADEAGFELPLDKQAVAIYSQEKIDALFFRTGRLSLQNLYPLFNYLQQEENIYFLKKDEEEKKAELDFLFQTQEQAEELDRLTKLIRELKALQDGLSEKIRQLGESANAGDAQAYLKLFNVLEIPYDVQEPFKEVLPANLVTVYEAYRKELNILEEFISAFSPAEYRLDKAREAIVFASQNNNLLLAFILQRINEGNRFASLEKLFADRNDFTRLLEGLPDDRLEDSWLEKLEFDAEFVQAYRVEVAGKIRQQQNISEIGRIISALNVDRNAVQEKGMEVPDAVHQPSHCPLCDSVFTDALRLQRAIDEKTQSLISFNTAQLSQLEEAQERIRREYRVPFEERAQLFLGSETNQLDAQFYDYLLEYRGYADRIRRFVAIIAAEGIDFNAFILDAPTSKEILLETLERLKSAMISTLATIVPNQNRLLHKELFKDLFAEDESGLISMAEVKSKQDYVEFKFNEARLFSLNILSERLHKFSALEAKVLKVKNALSISVKKYKMDMIEKIKMPFYLYSGKILQNYQQGLGIFIDMHENTNRIKFLTDKESDHDIIHHLSSGQLAVVSIAFCLSLNKVYETSNHFKFLAIDDPVQTLDDINIHSFIELVRHNFGDYQIVMSTHEDDIAGYLDYKFQKFGFACRTIKVQQIFYGTPAGPESGEQGLT